MTPEGKVKEQLRPLLRHPAIWSFWPVPNGYQAATLDVIGAVRAPPAIFMNRSWPFAIEAKRAGKDLTARQDLERTNMEAAGMTVFRVRNDKELEVFKQWLDARIKELNL